MGRDEAREEEFLLRFLGKIFSLAVTMEVASHTTALGVLLGVHCIGSLLPLRITIQGSRHFGECHFLRSLPEVATATLGHGAQGGC